MTMCHLVTLAVLSSAGALGDQELTEERKLISSVPNGAGWFGESCSMSGDLIAIGMPGATDNGHQSGAAAIHEATSGDEIWRVVPADGGVNHQYGDAVAIEGDYLVVGASNDPVNGGSSGSAYLYRISTRQLVKKLVPKDGATNDRFGYSVAIGDGRVVVGAPFDDDNGQDSGTVYVYELVTGDFLFKLSPQFASDGDRLGISVAVGTNVIAAGAPGAVVRGNDSGSVIVFAADNGAELGSASQTDNDPLDQFGCSVDIDGDYLVIGACFDDEYGNDAGAVYLHNVLTLASIHKYGASDAQPGDRFGCAVSIDSGIIVAGAYGSDAGQADAGAAYVHSAPSCVQLVKLVASEPSFNSQLGYSVATSGYAVVAGAWVYSGVGPQDGAVLVYGANCAADTNHDFMVSSTDFASWILAFNLSTSECDQNGDGSCTPTDFTAWIANYNAGCP